MRPQPGTLVRDTATGRLGLVLRSTVESVRLLPLRDGTCWVAALTDVRALSMREALSARLALVNARRTWGK
ncbi:hypothetical protein [Streptomyces montanisoli]|uniref:Uncharacterized protein n=1 Tax=Streptomyces montanisoli TaxID=2798581 RepID=A0A940RWS7_9ACTN|nr:hypothetical protein [Streptomyces montanisoli]MBP0459790.1 hypothetical protein [Streptomyces montanisoli]